MTHLVPNHANPLSMTGWHEHGDKVLPQVLMQNSAFLHHTFYPLNYTEAPDIF